jgi:hypothetical protein
MGTGCHGYLEWRVAGKAGRWHGEEAPALGRDYPLFAWLAGVRNWPYWEMELATGEKALVCLLPIAPPRGLPDDRSAFVRRAYGHSPDWHHATWLTREELEAVQRYWCQLPLRTMVTKRLPTEAEARARLTAFQAEGYTVSSWVTDLAPDGVYVGMMDGAPCFTIMVEKLLATRPPHEGLAAVLDRFHTLESGAHRTVRYVCWFDN